LIGEFEREGRRYIVAREDEPTDDGPERLTQRERQIVRLTCQGQSSKVVAYDLGISCSTVRVLLSRAMRKLGVRSRDELVNALAREQRVEGCVRDP
jgi:DNA-binding CsgD family transcriptional regulator